MARRSKGQRPPVAAAPPEEGQAQVGTTTPPVADARRLIAVALAGIAVRVGPLRKKEEPERMRSLILQGFTRQETAGIVGTTPNVVHARMCELARGGKKRGRRGKR